MQEPPKRRRTSRGLCALCGTEFGKVQMTRHLERHQAGQDTAPGGRVKCLHLVVEGRHSPEYWLHLDAQADAPLRDLDSFLRGIWLECCGHLSAFEINDVRYDVTIDDGSEEEEEDGDAFFGGLGLVFGGPPPKSMSVPLSEALTPGVKFTHQYDFGSTTELKLRVVSAHEGDPGPDAARLLARNVAPEFECEKYSEPAVWLGTDEEGEYRELCKKCAKRAKLDEWMLPIVNSPRTGVCGYEGPG